MAWWYGSDGCRGDDDDEMMGTMVEGDEDGVNTSTEASGSNPRSNTKKNRILPAKTENKKKVEDHPRTNKSVWTKVNRVDSSISSKRVIINSNYESVCKTCNKCLNSASHEMYVVNILNSVNATPTVKIVLNKGKQIWKPKGKLCDNSLNKTKQVWKATGKQFANVGYQWRSTGKKVAGDYEDFEDPIPSSCERNTQFSALSVHQNPPQTILA
ncbi:hypothetical protein Tco_1072948 [Tanacetum coccineum]